MRGGAIGAVSAAAFDVGAALEPYAPFRELRLDLLPSCLALLHLLTRRGGLNL